MNRVVPMIDEILTVKNVSSLTLKNCHITFKLILRKQGNSRTTSFSKMNKNLCGCYL